jgi:4-carboxymuconolactone decarboxylase
MTERPSRPRIAPATSFDEETAAIMSAGLTAPDGRPLNIFATLAHHPKLLKRFNLFAGYLLNKGLLPAREREIVILRVGHNCRSVYEFGQHTLIGRRCGITDAEISALTKSPDAHPWTKGDLALIALADDLCHDDCVSDATWEALSKRWGDAEMEELVMVAGTYRLVSGFLNSAGVQLDPGVPGWPA